MLARSSVTRALPNCCANAAAASSRRGMAAAATAPFRYSVNESSGVKVAARDDNGPTTSLAVIVRGGSRYQPAPGLAHALAKFAFKNTTKRSALRLTRESELLGGQFHSSVTRENIVLGAKFLRDDLPYFVEALGDVLTKTKYAPYTFNEEVAPTMGYEIDEFHHSAAAQAVEAAHNVAFHTGLGANRLALTNKYLSSDSIPQYASEVHQKGNIALVASGAPEAEVQKYASEFFEDVLDGSGPKTSPSKYHGGESRTFSPYGDALVIAFPGSSAPPSFKPEFNILAYILGGQSATKWNAGTSLLCQATAGLPGVSAIAKHAAYSDTGLLYITVAGPSPFMTKAGEAVVKTLGELNNIKAEDVKKAIAQAKYDILASAEDRTVGLEVVGQSVIAGGKAPQFEETVKALEGVSVESVTSAAKSLLDGKASFAAVGDLHYLPFASDIGLKV